MSYIAALFLPSLPLFLKGRIPLSVLLLVLQVTVIGWIPATLIAWAVVSEENTKKAMRKEIRKANAS